MTIVSIHPSAEAAHVEGEGREASILHALEHAAHLLPSQGPIAVFVHHNTLHAFEDESFCVAVQRGLEQYDCQPYWPESRYREELARGRIVVEDLREMLIEDLGDSADHFVGLMGTRYHLRLAMLEHPILFGTNHEVHWLLAEAAALKKFRPEASTAVRDRMCRQTSQWVLENWRRSATLSPRIYGLLKETAGRFGELSSAAQWSDSVWEAVTLHLLWQTCRHGAHAAGVARGENSLPPSIRPRDWIVKLSRQDLDIPVNDWLTRFAAAFLDQGLANWPLPNRHLGLYQSFLRIHEFTWSLEPWMQGVHKEARRLREAGVSPLQSIAESLQWIGVDAGHLDDSILRTLLALRGWAGMIWQMETNAEWTVRPAPKGSLTEFLAVRLILERAAIKHWMSKQPHSAHCDLSQAHSPAGVLPLLRKLSKHETRQASDHTAYSLFQLAQVRGWGPVELLELSQHDWRQLITELESFNELERRRIYHAAYERRYRNQALDALCVASRDRLADPPHPKFQVITCIDDREESFRRHLEEIEPACQTFGAPGFFAVAMYYQGASDAHFRPLCPVVITPKHYVRETSAYSLMASSRQRAEARKRLGAASRQFHLQSRSMMGGVVTSVLGSFASIPLVARVLFPRLTARCNEIFGSITRPPAVTELVLSRVADPPANEDGHLGFSYEEMAGSVERVLRDIGLTSRFAPMVMLLGHGSGSLNNPHESAYDCGACSGGRGGPNARAFAWMANHPKVRQILASRGLVIPDETVFVGGFHNTCDDDVIFFDLDALPLPGRKDFEAARDVIDLARARNAHERSRRFASADPRQTPQQALEHVQARAEDLSQARPEYNHATNALCVVGRRSLTRGLFLDRRSFLADYDPTQDDGEAAILARILAAAIPVCAGISLEYYFSCVDPSGYGCGSKLPHNVTSLLGVMEGATSDLRTGLSQQMIEIHEPMRILFVIECTPAAMLKVIAGNATIERLVCNSWVQLAVMDPSGLACHVFEDGRFVPYEPHQTQLPIKGASLECYQGERDHLPFARIIPQKGASNP